MSDRRLDLAIDRARRHLASARLPDGSFPDRTDAGPSFTAFPLIALHYAGHPLPAAEAAEVVAWLRRQQRADGSFAGHPFAPTGDPCATAVVWAALRCCGLPEGDESVAGAFRYVEASGGLEQVARALYAKTDFAALFVAMAGLLDPSSLPMPPPGLVLNTPVERFLRARFDYLNVVVGLVAAGAIVGDLRRRKERAEDAEARAHGAFLAGIAASFHEAVRTVGDAIAPVDGDAAITFLRGYQNPNGSLDDTTIQTALLVAAYRALGLDRDDPRVVAAADWLRGMRVSSGGEAWFSCFTGDVWSTALAGRALVSSGTARADPELARTVTWFLDTQILDEKAVRTVSRPGAPLAGGWAFEGGNVTMPDCDDTGLVLATLGMAGDRTEPGDPGLPEPLAARVLAAVEKACAWLEGNQNPDGGWSAFDYWEGTKPRGPMYTSEIGLISDDALKTLENLVSPPIGLGAPAWEDVTGRVLYGLGYSGYTVASPVVARALDFLRAQQLDHGGFWGRWMVNYLPTTAYVLLGLAAVELSPGDPMVRRAVDFLVAHQNGDGGWGEVAETYRDPSRAGAGPSMAPLTGLVLTALIEAGEGASEAVQRGVAYLLDEQRPDGSWPNGDWLHVLFPPQSFYVYFLMPALYPLEALGRHRTRVSRGEVESGSVDAASHERASELGQRDPGTTRPGVGSRDDASLDRMRAVGDPTADRVIAALLDGQQAEAVNRLMMTLARSDDPVPAGLPAVARAYFEETAALPAFADPAQLAIAARMFTRVGWSVAAGLFCAALPQTYCAARGAKVLVYSGRLDLDPRRRILETAQFIFDVTDHGAFEPGGRGVRSAQKVRLMHATLRHLTLAQARWDLADGVPINQEDLAATLMAFSAVILDALDRFTVEIAPEERAAWMHLWRVVGALLGVDPAVSPVDEADAGRRMETFRRRHWRPSPQGEMLARALVTCMEAYMPSPLLQRLPATLIRHLGGDACADLLRVPRATFPGLLVEAADEVLGLAQDRRPDPRLGALLDRFSAELMKALITVQRGDKQAPFRLPASLRST
jgi:squalene cyclase